MDRHYGQTGTMDRQIMQIALEEARAAATAGEVPVGAVVTDKDGAIIARVHNRVEELKDPTAHAEILAIREATKKLGDWRLNDCRLFVTLEPCPMCAGAIILSRISTVVFCTRDQRLGAGGSLYNLLRHPSHPHEVRVIEAVLERESKELLREFFAKLRG